MKRKILPLAIGAAIAAQAGLVQADATVYGKINLTAQTQDEVYGTDNPGYSGATKKDDWELNSNASRLGVKGKAKINDDIDAVFKMEYETCVDDGVCGNNQTFNQRNIVGGLSSKTYGTLVGGKNDTPLKMAADGTDMFNDLPYGDITTYMVGENREDNIVLYTSPEFFHVTVTAATMLGEEDGVDEDFNTAKGNADTQDDGLFERTSMAVKWAPSENFWTALSADQNVKNTDILRLNTYAALGNFSFNGQIQQASANNNDLNEDFLDKQVGEGIGGNSGLGGVLKPAMDGLGGNCASLPSGVQIPPGANGCDWYKAIEDQDAWMVNGKYQLGNWAFKAQVGKSTSSTYSVVGPMDQSVDFDAKQVAMGVDYALSKNVTVFGYLAQIDVDVPNAVDFDGDGKTDDENDGEFKTGGVGFEVKF